MFTRLARQADKFSIIRSMTHGHFSHQAATYVMQTGMKPDSVIYVSGQRVSGDRDSIGEKRSRCPFSRQHTNGSVGGSKAREYSAPLDVCASAGWKGSEGDVHPGNIPLVVLDLAAGAGCPTIESFRSASAGKDSLVAIIPSEVDGGYKAELAREVCDLSQEREDLRDSYGESSWGRAMLVARRLVERGVPLITLNLAGWDTHQNHFKQMQRLLPRLDQALAALLADLAARGLLDQTIVLCHGEFGRTPRIDERPPFNGGRHHWGHAMSVLLAGGGFKGGRVVGESDLRGEYPKECPVAPWDLIANIHAKFGIELAPPVGRAEPVVASNRANLPRSESFKNPLAEIV